MRRMMPGVVIFSNHPFSPELLRAVVAIITRAWVSFRASTVKVVKTPVAASSSCRTRPGSGSLTFIWIVGVGKRVVGKLPAMERLKYIVNILLFVNVVVVVATGIWISEVAMGQLGVGFETNMLWRQLHTLSADWILWLVALHLALNWRWVTNTAKRYLWQPVVRLFSKPAPTLTPTQEIVR